MKLAMNPSLRKSNQANIGTPQLNMVNHRRVDHETLAVRSKTTDKQIMAIGMPYSKIEMPSVESWKANATITTPKPIPSIANRDSHRTREPNRTQASMAKH
jgi:hypothetical protein